MLKGGSAPLVKRQHRRGCGEDTHSRKVRLPAGKDRRVGNWSDGDFAEGTIHSVLFHKAKNGELEPFAGDICGFMTADRIDHSFYHEDDLSSYYLGDAHYDHGDCELIDSSVQPIKTILGYSD